jgi:hypothetical protein
MTNGKTCFVICPLGDPDSPIRERADQLLDHTIKPTLNDFDYSISRADLDSDPGMITPRIMRKVIQSDLVIADLSGGNENVYYELAVRHAVGDPVIHLINDVGDLSFDLNDMNAIEYDFDSVAKHEEAKDELEAQVRAIENEEQEYTTPVSHATESISLRSDDQPELADIYEAVNEMNAGISRLEDIDQKLDEMAKVNESGTRQGINAESDIRSFIHASEKWLTVDEIADKIEYAEPMVRHVCDYLADSGQIERRETNHRVIGLIIDEELVIPSDEPITLRSLISEHAEEVPDNLQSMKVEELQKYLRENVSDGTVPLETEKEYRA